MGAIIDFLVHLFDTSGFPARWTCGLWSPGHGWLHVLSDLGIWSAYFTIPVVLAFFVWRRRDLPFRSVFVLFGAFILLCGTTHLMDAALFWWPAYRLAGVVKLLTAAVSWLTVLALVRVAPTVLAMRSPGELEREIAARVRAEDGLQRANAELERRVAERTADLARSVSAVAEEKERLRTTLASIGDAVISTDRDGNVTYLNAVAESLTGWANGAAAGVPLTRVFQIVNESTRQPVENPAFRALTEGVIVGLANHTVLIAKDGTERLIDDSAAPIRCKDGEIVGGVLVFRDVGERRRLEGERQEAQERVVATLESVTDGFVRYDRDWRIVYVNAEAERINQLARSEMLGRTVWEVFPAIVGTKLEAEFRRAVAEQVTVEFENYYEPFGRWYSLKGYPTAAGGLTTFIRDITEQKAHREALAASEARFRELADAMPQIVSVTDAAGRVEFINRQWLDYTGRSDAQTADLAPVVHPDDLADLLRQREQSAASASALQTEFRLRRAADGEYRWFLTRSVPVRDAGGRVVTWYGTSTDIHDQKRAEQEIARLAAGSERERRLYETVLTNTPDFVYVFSLDHRVVYANEALIRMWGRGHAGAIGKTFLEIGYEPWHAAMHDREIDQVRATKQPIRGEVPFDGTNGRRQYEYIFVPVLGTDGEVEAVAGTTRDVTERKEAERQLRDGQEQLDFALAAADLGQWSLNLSDHTARRTLRHDQIFGYDAPYRSGPTRCSSNTSSRTTGRRWTRTFRRPWRPARPGRSSVGSAGRTGPCGTSGRRASSGGAPGGKSSGC